MVPRHLVKKHTFLPLFIDDDRLLIACVDQPEHELEEELRLRYGVPVRPVIATPRSIKQAIAKYYAPANGTRPGRGSTLRKEAFVYEDRNRQGKGRQGEIDSRAQTGIRSTVRVRTTAAQADGPVDDLLECDSADAPGPARRCMAAVSDDPGGMAVHRLHPLVGPADGTPDRLLGDAEVLEVVI